MAGSDAPGGGNGPRKNRPRHLRLLMLATAIAVVLALSLVIPYFVIIVFMGFALAGYVLGPACGALAVAVVAYTAYRIVRRKLVVDGTIFICLSAASLLMLIAGAWAIDGVEMVSLHFGYGQAATLGLVTMLSLAALAGVFLSRKMEKGWLLIGPAWLLWLSAGLVYIMIYFSKYLGKLLPGEGLVYTDSGYPVEMPFMMIEALLGFYIVLFALTAVTYLFLVWRGLRDRRQREYRDFFHATLKN